MQKTFFFQVQLLKHNSHFEADFICFPISKIPRPVFFQLSPRTTDSSLLNGPCKQLVHSIQSFQAVIFVSTVIIFKIKKTVENMGTRICFEVYESTHFYLNGGEIRRYVIQKAVYIYGGKISRCQGESSIFCTQQSFECKGTPDSGRLLSNTPG